MKITLLTRFARTTSAALAFLMATSVMATSVTADAAPSAHRSAFVRSNMFSSNASVALDAIVRDAIGRSAADRGIAAFATARRGGYRDLGRYASNAPVHLGLLLRYQHEAELAQLTYLQGEPSSPYFHRYVTSDQWNAYFAPSQATVNRIALEMSRRGFRVTRILPNRTIIDVSGTAATTERLFSTQLHRVYQARSNRYSYANVTAARLPAFLSGSVTSVAGIHSTDAAFYPEGVTRAASLARAAARRATHALRSSMFATSLAGRVAADASPSPKPVTTSTPAANPNPEPTLPAGVTNVHGMMGGFGPVAYAASYDEPDMHGYAGAGQNIGNVISGDFANSDLKAQEADFSIPRSKTATLNRVPVDTYFQVASNGSADDGESTLDVEAMLGLAYDANYYEYLVNTLADLAIEDAYNKVVNDNIVSVVNSSFGGCETDDPSWGYATNYIAMQGAAKGITFNASTGDTGGNGCDVVTNGAPGAYKGVAFPSVDYYFTAVGGTDLVANPQTGAYVQETGWETGGGGYSAIDALPSWQAAAVAAATVPQTGGRNTPDVAFDASLETGYEIYEGGESLTGGTSLASPIFAATQLLINQVQGSRHGWVNPRLYEIYAAQSSGFAINDILVGQNELYVCGPGYDDVTGLGSLDGWKLAGTE